MGYTEEEAYRVGFLQPAPMPIPLGRYGLIYPGLTVSPVPPLTDEAIERMKHLPLNRKTGDYGQVLGDPEWMAHQKSLHPFNGTLTEKEVRDSVSDKNKEVGKTLASAGLKSTSFPWWIVILLIIAALTYR